MPQWPRIIGPNSDRNTLSIRSKDLELAHSPECLGSFVVRITGKPFALGQSHPLLGYLVNGELHWFDLCSATNRQFNLRAERTPQADGRVYRIAFSASDGRGGTCSGTATVSVPRHTHEPAVDSAPPN